MIFTNAQQQIFDYIWNHPGSTIAEIEQGLWGRNWNTNLVATQLTKMRDRLEGTIYVIFAENIPGTNRGTPRCRYSIKALTNANV